ncbi:hypothetical protein MTR67_001625 [Solanum verrucosum]|uniref:Uncharacterized protein n=1 Tax=Solanum verrucosum TaxID=315347 RepID=A0AAF0PQX4_SOLVR|nr:hypothetical protein MTR67_001625 [Solanum verrucosum]
MKGGEESSMSSNSNTNNNGKSEVKKMTKPPFRPAKDDTKPLLQDPVSIPFSISFNNYSGEVPDLSDDADYAGSVQQAIQHHSAAGFSAKMLGVFRNGICLAIHFDVEEFEATAIYLFFQPRPCFWEEEHWDSVSQGTKALSSKIKTTETVLGIQDSTKYNVTSTYIEDVVGSSGGDRKKVAVGEGKGGLSVEKNGVLFKSDGESLIRLDKDFYGDCDVYDGEWVRDDTKPYILRVLALLLIEILIVTLIRGQMMSISSGDGSHMHMTYRGTSTNTPSHNV